MNISGDNRPLGIPRLNVFALLVVFVAFYVSSAGVARSPIAGADISALSDIEHAGGIFKDRGVAGDEIRVLRDHGCTVFRVRLFVDPNPSYSATGGATQNLSMVLELAKRIKAAGGRFLLDLHYSDTWADPQHQQTPKAWQSLDFKALKAKVAEYTKSTINDLQAAGVPPDMVQIGNEITVGMLWPTGAISSKGSPDQQRRQWQQFVQLVQAGVAGVRASEKGGSKIAIMLHVSGGGKTGVPQWFFKNFLDNGGRADDFDMIGLSFYPAWDDSLDTLTTNLEKLAVSYKKDIWLAELSYPWKPMHGFADRPTMKWRQSPEGQVKFLEDVRSVLNKVPDGHGTGFLWWFPDAIPVPGLRIWRDGAEALFDLDGNALPAIAKLGG